MKYFACAIVLGALLSSGMCAAQSPSSAPATDKALDSAARGAIVDGVIQHLKADYVFLETAEKMAARIQEISSKGGYDEIVTPQSFAQRLTIDLRQVSKDRHLQVLYMPLVLPAPGSAAPTPIDVAPLQNFGFERVERMDGNVGYLDLRAFMDPARAAPAAAAAMSFLANTDALIIDLRNNGGGSAQTVALLCSYLFDQRTHLNDLYVRRTDKTDEFWTVDDLAGKRYGQAKPVYLLTSRYTFSAAEEFAYNLKSQKRATLVGETTGGGAHPVMNRRVGDRFAVIVPFARAINPITKTNWEGEGVQPDVAVASFEALGIAHLHALQAVIDGNKNAARAPVLQGQKIAAEGMLESVRALHRQESALPMDFILKEPAGLRATPAGQVAVEFLSVLNSGNAAAMRRFNERRSNNIGAAMQDYALYKDSGGFRIHSVVNSTPSASDRIVLLAQRKKDDQWRTLTFFVHDLAPHRILRIEQQPAASPK